jgi:hypothetical protein
MNTIKVTERDGVLGLLLTFIAAPEMLNFMLHTIHLWGLLVWISVCWQMPIIISYKEKKISIRVGWDVL